MNNGPKLIYEIWESEDGTEASMFPRNKSKAEYDFLTTDTQGKRMIRRKIFRTNSLEHARSVYNELFGF